MLDPLIEAFLTSDERRTRDTLIELARRREPDREIEYACCATWRTILDEGRDEPGPYATDEHDADCGFVAICERNWQALTRFETDMVIKYGQRAGF